MRHLGRWLTILIKFNTLLLALTWAWSRREIGSTAGVILLLAVSIAGLRRELRLPRTPAAIVSGLVIAAGVAVILNRALVFASAVQVVWAGFAALASLVWLCTHPAVRRAASAWLHAEHSAPRAWRIFTLGAVARSAKATER